MNDYKNIIYKYYAPFLPSNNHENASSGSEYDSAKQRVRLNKQYFGFIIK